jgi:hypothetical protein
MRVLLITHQDLAFDPHRSESDFVTGLELLVDLTVAEFDRPSVRAYAESPNHYDAIVVFVRFRLRMDDEAWDWNGFHGLKVCIEHDAWGSYVPGPLDGRYGPALRRDRFDLVISTGKATAKLLRADGVPAHWIPKGFSTGAFRDLGLDRSGVCTYGTMWPSRRALLHHIGKAIHVEDVSGPYPTLNDRLNLHLASVVCNMPSTVPLGRLGRRVQRHWPPFVRLSPAVEPMIKTFETAASGTALVVDRVQDLEPLGFVHGENCLLYTSFEEATHLLITTSDSDFRSIGRAGADLCAQHHTWRHRAGQFADVMAERIRG